MKNKKFITEIVIIFIIALVVFLISYEVLSFNKSTYKYFSVFIDQSTINISSPVYGQVINLPFSQGSYVKKGEKIASIFTLANNNNIDYLDKNLFTLNNEIFTLKSPCDCIIENITVAKNSTVIPQEIFITEFPQNSIKLGFYVPLNFNIKKYSHYEIYFKSVNKTFNIKKLTSSVKIINGSFQKVVYFTINSNNIFQLMSSNNNIEVKAY